MVFAGTPRRLGLNCRMARPLLVVPSGKTTIDESGFSWSRVASETSRELGGGVLSGGVSARKIAWKREMRWTSGVDGYEAVKMGSKMAARYKQSMGEVKEDAMIDPGCGTRFWCFARDLVFHRQQRLGKAHHALPTLF